ncbi:PAS domain S-box protein [Desulfoplanes sp.]
MITTIKSKIFQKTLAIMVLGFGIIAATCSVVAGWILHDHLIREYESKAIAIGNSITTSLPETFLKQNAATDQSIIDQYLDIKGVAYALVKTEDGEIIAHTFSPSIPKSILAIITENTPDTEPGTGIMGTRLLQTKSYLDVCSPILMGKAGYVHIGMDMGLIKSYIFDAIVTMQVILFGVLLLCVVITFFLIKRISGPLFTLTEYANQLAEQRFDAAMPVTSNDEIGMLAQTMQSMASRINGLVQGLEAKISSATAELQDTSLYLSVLVDSMADGLLVTDEKGHILNFNPALLSIFGLSHAKMATKDLLDFLDQEALETLYRNNILTHDAVAESIEFTPTVLDKGTMHNELYTHRTDGQKICVEFSMASVNMKCGIQCILVVRDITVRKNAQKRLEQLNDELEERITSRTHKLEMSNNILKKEILNRKSTEDALLVEKELFSTTLRSINDGVITLDNEGRILFINQAMENLGGWSVEETRGKQFCTVFQITMNNGPLYLNRNVQDHANLHRLENEQDALFKNRQDTMLDIAIRVLPLYDKQSVIKGQVLVMQDITERKRQEQERLKTEKLESIGILAGGIAHDFNNILTAVLNYIFLAQKSPALSPRAGLHLKKAHRAGLRAQQLTQQLLTFSKGGAPIIELRGIQDLISDSVTFALRGSNIKTSIHISPDIWNAEIDQGQIAQVFENLAINANQAMSRGGTLTITAHNVIIDSGSRLPLQPGQYIEISFTDQGPGIPEEYQKKIFDPYFTTKKTGSGLGLATTYSIITNHRGHIRVSSHQEKGTTFSIFLPASETELSRPIVSIQPPSLAGKGTILLMDDDESIRDVMEESLGFLGYEVLTASEGNETLELYKRHTDAQQRIDLVLMDLTIPGGMGGKETVGKLLEIDPDAKIIVSSGYSQDPVMANYESYGFIDILPKPYTLDDVGKKLSAIIGRPNGC